MITIPLKTWLKWTPEERGQVTQYYEAIGKQWMIGFTPDWSCDHTDIQKDYEQAALEQNTTVADLLRK